MKNAAQIIGRQWKRIALFLLLVAAIGAYRSLDIGDYLTFETLKEHRKSLQIFVDRNYAKSVLIFIAIYLSTAFFVPGAVIMTMAAGFLFGVAAGVVYVNIAATSGAFLAFLLSRYLIGNWIQKRFSARLKSFNREIALHGQNHLLVLRILPLFPFFVINYLAGLTQISMSRFIWTTALGMLPGSILYTYAGRQLGRIEQVRDLFSAEFIIAFSAFFIFASLPMLVRFGNWLKTRRGKPAV